jgi:flagellar basal-body rod modification protein FlgD
MSAVTASQEYLSSIGIRTEPEVVAESNASQKADFLLLMTEQIKHQNPLNPMEGADFLGQLAQFSMVEGIEQLNASFASLSDELVADQSLQAASMIGKHALVASQYGHLGSETPISGVIDVPQPGQVTLNFYDEVGQLVRQLDLGTHNAGPLEFSWDGMRDNGQWAGTGTYRIEAVAETGEGPQALPTLVESRVESVNLWDSGGGLTLNLEGLGTTYYNDIYALK